MEIEIYEKKRTTLVDFADQHGLIMEIRERTPEDLGSRWSEDRRYYARFKGGEIKDGGVLQASYGNGSTPEMAMRVYAKEISGGLLVLNAYTSDRREIYVPLLTA